MDRLEAMSVIVAVAETGSFSAAARRLGKPVATVSRKVADLETRLKAEVFQRSSRWMTLTDAGRDYVEACRRIIEQVEDAERQVSGEYRSPKGDLVVTTPWGLGHTHVLPIAVEFLDDFPEIGLRLLLTDRVVDTVEENIDIAIRIGNLPESSMIATRIASIRVVVCASPEYLSERGRPQSPDDLRDHDCIAINEIASPAAWNFSKGKRVVSAPIGSRLCVNTSEAAVLAAIAGAGLTRVMSYKMDAARRAGSLELVLEAFEPEPLPVHIVYAPRNPVPLKLRAFLNWVTPRLKARLAFPDDTLTLGLYFMGMMISIPLAFGWAFYLAEGLVPFMIILFFLGFAGGNFAVFSLWLPEQYETRVRATAFAFVTSVGPVHWCRRQFPARGDGLTPGSPRHSGRLDRHCLRPRPSDHSFRHRDKRREFAGITLAVSTDTSKSAGYVSVSTATGIRRVPVTTISVARLPHFEQLSRACQSMTVVSAPYRSACSVRSGST
jgi:DNA-binding transcriptional LysR family regulator